MKSLGFVSFICALAVGACDPYEFVLPGQIQKATDVVLAQCDGGDSKEEARSRTCLVFAQPWAGQVRVFDLAQNQFWMSAVGYEAWAIKAGSFVAGLEGIPSWPYVYGVDAITGQIIVIPLVKGTAHSEIFQFPPSPSPVKQVVLMQGKKNVFALLLSDNQIEAIPLDPQSGQPIIRALTKKVFLGAAARLEQLFIREELGSFFVTDRTQNQIFSFALDEIEQASAEQIVPLSITSLSVRPYRVMAAYVTLGEKKEKAFFILHADKYAASLILPQREGQNQFTMEFPTKPLEVYFPGDGALSACKDTIPLWALVATADGKLHYISLQGMMAGKQEAACLLDVGSVDRFKSEAALISRIIGIPHPPEKKDAKQECSRKLILLFGTSLVLEGCEGSVELKRLEKM